MIHKHKYKMKSSYIVDVYKIRNYSDIRRTETEILCVCQKCGKLKTKTINGEWTNKDLGIDE